MFAFSSNFSPASVQTWRRLAGRTTRAYVAMAMALILSQQALAQVISYEGNAFPEELGWERLPQNDPHGERTLDAGWLIQTLGLPPGWPGPTGEADSYRKGLSQFVGVDGFFVEWRAVTDNPAWLIDEWLVPTVAVAGGNAASLYHTVMTESAAAFFRDVNIPVVIAPISAMSPHVYRVEVTADAYIWYIDGIVADLGTPEGTYPDANARLTWGARREYVDATTAWDYVRAGRIPDYASGDYDSNAIVTLTDHYFVVDCLTKDGPGIFGGPEEDAGPGCRFADFDADTDADLADFAAFQNLFGVELP